MDETTRILLASLRHQRSHVLGILEGVDEESLRRPILPSGWSCLGLVQHLALDVERFWFRMIVAGELELPAPDAPSAWDVGPDRAAGAVFALYRDEAACADEVILARPLDAPPATWPHDLFGDFRLKDLRAVLVHVLTETATHAGHLDAARELIDGRRWLTLT